MSFFPGKDPLPGDAFACDAIEHLIIPRTTDLGGFSGAPRASEQPAAAGRAVHLLRPHGSGGAAGPAKRWMSGRIRISACRPSPIFSTAKSATWTASARKRSFAPAIST